MKPRASVGRKQVHRIRSALTVICRYRFGLLASSGRAVRLGLALGRRSPFDRSWWDPGKEQATAISALVVLGNAPSGPVHDLLRDSDFVVGINGACNLESEDSKKRLDMRVVNRDCILNPLWLRPNTPQLLHCGRQTLPTLAYRQAVKFVDPDSVPPNIAWAPDVLVEQLGADMGLAPHSWPSSGAAAIQWALLSRGSLEIWIHGFSLENPANAGGFYRRGDDPTELDPGYHEWEKEHRWLRSLVAKGDIGELHRRKVVS